ERPGRRSGCLGRTPALQSPLLAGVACLRSLARKRLLPFCRERLQLIIASELGSLALGDLHRGLALGENCLVHQKVRRWSEISRRRSRSSRRSTVVGERTEI